MALEEQGPHDHRPSADQATGCAAGAAQALPAPGSVTHSEVDGNQGSDWDGAVQGTDDASLGEGGMPLSEALAEVARQCCLYPTLQCKGRSSMINSGHMRTAESTAT